MATHGEATSQDPFHFWKERDLIASTTTPRTVSNLPGQRQRDNTCASSSTSLQKGKADSNGPGSYSKLEIAREKKESSEELSQLPSSVSTRRPPPPRPTTSPRHNQAQPLYAKLKSRSTDEGEASSYTPISRKSTTTTTPTKHRQITKSTSNPVQGYGMLHSSVSANGLQQDSTTYRRSLNQQDSTTHKSPEKQTASTTYRSPTKQTYRPQLPVIRASKGDQLSQDDLELYRPQRRNVENSSRVSAITKEINISFLDPGLMVHAEGRRGSSGDISQLPEKDLTIRSSPGTSRPSISTITSETTPSGKSRNWRSQSASKVRSNSNSVKIKSSGFTSYLDGPIEPVVEEVKPRPPTPPPSSPLFEVSHFLKNKDLPEGNHLRPCVSAMEETVVFWEMVERIRSQFCPGNSISLTSPVISQHVQHKKPSSSSSSSSSSSPAFQRRNDSIYVSAGQTKDSVLLQVREGGSERPPVELTSNVKTPVKSVLSKVTDRLFVGNSKLSREYALKVCGRDETLEDDRLLCDYEYIHQCRKFATPVELVCVEKKKPSPVRDRRGSPIMPEIESSSSLSFHVKKCVSIKEANSLLDSYHAKEDKFRIFMESNLGPSYILTMVQSVVSCVRHMSERLSFIEPPEVTDAVFNLRRACKLASQPELESSNLFPVEDSMNRSSISLSDNWIAVPDKEFSMSEDHIQDILCALDVLRNSVHNLMSMYCTSFCPGYKPEWDMATREVHDISHSDHLLRIRIMALHKPVEEELQKYDTLQMECCVYHGGRSLSKHGYSPHAKISRNFFKTVVWNKWLNMSLPISSLPLESRVLFILHGLEFPGSGIKWSRTPIAWAVLRLYNINSTLLRGTHLIGMWMGEEADPLGSPFCSVHNKKSMLLQVELEDYNCDYQYHVPVLENPKSNFPGPPPNVSKTLTNLAQKDRFYTLTASDQKIIWANRLACVPLLWDYSRGLPMVLISAESCNSGGDLAEVWKFIEMWKLSDPKFGLELLDAQFSDMKVRAKAVEWLSNLNNDDICDFLPQLVQSMRYDSFLSSPMAEFLLVRSTQSHRIAHSLFWHLQLAIVTDTQFQERYIPVLEALKRLSGEQLRQEFINQVELVEQLCAVATAVKNMRDSHRQTTLIEELKKVADKFVGQFRLPLNPALLVKGIDIESCSFFNSNTVPLKLSFINADPFGDNISIIFKVGDDLRQDIVILQMIRLMEKIWLRAGLDLKMVTYQCVATGDDQGMLELVGEAATLRAIQTKHGLTGSFKDKPLSEWLQRHNSTESAYKQAVENFTLSCAGYCVATYILGICDRHNDNIMVKKSGHMFHIDFGKILGNAQMFGNIKRDRAPFVLTRDMAYVINDGDKPTVRFQKFSDLCCTAYCELRKHTTLFVSLLSLILSSGLPEVSSLEDVQYVRDALLPGKSEFDATYAFTKYIEDSLGSLATTLNFFIHNLAQYKFSSSNNAPSLLSFSPQAYSIATDGKIESAIITMYHKWFYPETYYVYQIEVKRGAPEKEKIFRRYREFDELQSKLEQCFPDAALPHLPGKIFLPGKSHTKQTTERRMIELNMYLASVLSMPTYISESDIIYTFLHCLIRDEQDLAKLREGDVVQTEDYGAGKVKLELLYNRKQEKLSVMVRHVKDLVPREGSDTADPYVKLYLLPDPSKSTKMKTKISKKTLNPTYNETFSYSIAPSSLGNRALQLSIWDASNVLGNHCISLTTIELSKLLTQLNNGSSFVEWFDLYSLPNL